MNLKKKFIESAPDKSEILQDLEYLAEVDL